MVTVIVLFVFGISIAYDSRTILKNIQIKTKVIYWVLMTIGFVVIFLYSLDFTIPSLTLFIVKIVRSIYSFQD